MGPVSDLTATTIDYRRRRRWHCLGRRIQRETAADKVSRFWWTYSCNAHRSADSERGGGDGARHHCRRISSRFSTVFNDDPTEHLEDLGVLVILSATTSIDHGILGIRTSVP